MSRAQKSTAQFEPPSSSRSSSSGSPPPPFLPFDSRQRPSEPGKKQSSYNEPLRIDTFTRFSQTRLSTHTREQSKIFVPDFAPPSPPFCVHSFARAERRKEGRREKKRQRGSEIKRWRERGRKKIASQGHNPLYTGRRRQGLSAGSRVSSLAASRNGENRSVSAAAGGETRTTRYTVHTCVGEKQIFTAVFRFVSRSI